MKTQILNPPDRRFWLCRADGGRNFSHFWEHDVIAMGHFDVAKSLNLNMEKDELAIKLHKTLENNSKIKSKTITNHVNQAIHFVFDARINDLVMTVDHGTIAIGKITSRAYFEKESLFVKSERDPKKEYRMDSYLRRDVKWVGHVRRFQLPYALSRGITGQQTFFSLDEYEDEIYSLVSPFVYREGILTTNLLIRKEEDISTYHFNKLTSTFLKAEFLAENLPLLAKVKSERDLDELFETFCRSGKIHSHLKAEFASPGRTSNETKISPLKKGAYAIMLSIALTGGKVDLPFIKAEANGFLDKETVAYVVKYLSNNIGPIVVEWIRKESIDLKDELKLTEPGKNIDAKELEAAPTVFLAEKDEPKKK